MKKFESRGKITENPFDLDLVNNNGELVGGWYLLKGAMRKKITLKDLINEQVDFVSNGNKTPKEKCEHFARIGSSGNSAQIGSSGNSAQIGSSGNFARIGSSGNSVQIGSSGYSVRIGSSGNSAQIGSSGYFARIGSSGNSVQIGSSGYSAQIGSSGNFVRIGSSGNFAWIDVMGDWGVSFACGHRSVIRAKAGTWISLCEYKMNENRVNVPIFAQSAQIGNPEYIDFKGEVLSENEYYILKDKKFTPVIMDDGLLMIKKYAKIKDGIEIIKCAELGSGEEAFCVRKGKLIAHGVTLKQALSDIAFKELRNRDINEIVEKIKKCGYVTREDYRCITGACAFGTEQFAKEHGYADVEKVEINELLLKLDDSYYGAKKFKDLFR